MGRKKITVIGGAGNVGASVACYASMHELGDIVLLDVAADRAQGIGLDMYEAAPVHGVDTNITGGDDFEESKDSDLVIITAGLPRKPGMSRDDLLVKNVGIVGGVAEKAAKLSPNAVMIVVANPLDAMVYTAWKKSGFDPRKVMGMAGVLDTARFKAFIAMELNVSVEDIQAMVLGGHGDDMVPLTSHCTVGGIPINHFIGEDRLKEIVDRTRKGGGEIVALLKTGSAYYAPAASTVEMAKSVIKDKKRILPVAAYLDGEFGHKGIFVGVPAKIGAGGVEEVIDLALQGDDKKALEKSISGVKTLKEEVDTLLR